MLRYFLAAGGALAAAPLLAVLALLPTTPITGAGALYVLGCLMVAGGMASSPWWRRGSLALALLGGALVFVLAFARLALPQPGSGLTLTSLPSQAGPRWLNRLIEEQDIVLFGARAAPFLRAVLPAEEVGLVPTLARAYAQMRSEGATPDSPFLMTLLGQQQPAEFDAVVAELPEGVSPTSAMIFLHGYGGNFTLQCWLVAQAGRQVGAITVCPSTSHSGDWWSPRGVAILEQTRSYLRQRGIQRVYLAGLSNGAIGASRLAQSLEADFAGLILISGADPGAPISRLPVLVVHGTRDERIPAVFVERYVAAAGPRATYRAFDGDHFVLLRQAELVQGAIAAWLSQQERL